MNKCDYIVCDKVKYLGTALCKEHCTAWDNAISILVCWVDNPVFANSGGLRIGWSSVIDFYYEYERNNNE